ncbi:hypothetical protein EOA32_01060 [Mesorhizobium sp. M1A.F.Ca.ET.072.01.1.1]|uniref:hypothetical protein n=1 Tax=Mesorhizobium sp. M1A.F.Ca.ET.072.01.1.1 TaxID=2496753 RepID=UPI000FD243FC|nr:hypothetical protein [Mesorhizobium sp. M1A.F.Ca.ET.072.01.1.1]RUW55639.1 hypothetical protein EOA32_01060 [Mesorhizobium sp. M1A.F.Ca.ET.072.01.1.1]
MKAVLVVFVMTNGQFVEQPKHVLDPMTDKPFATVEKCNTWLNMAVMMAASKDPDAAKKVRFECRPV